MFILNRDLSKARTVEINWQDKTPGAVLVSSVLTGTDLKAFNTFEAPQKVVPQPFDKPATTTGRTKLEVPARSYTVIRWSA
jgi:alpha-L-arabinofuranosidase